MFDLIYPSGVVVPMFPRPTVDNPGEPVPDTSEILPIIEPDGIVIGRASRAYCHAGTGLLHPVVHLHLEDHMGRIYLQKRSASKDLYPGYWDTAVGGHLTYGETVLEALYREAAEELGLRAFNPVWLGSYIYENGGDREYVCMFAAVGNFNIHPDNLEVQEGEWWTVERIEENLGKSVITPNFEEEFGRIRKTLASLL